MPIERHLSQEFQLIRDYFYREYPTDCSIILGNGDDCALVRPINPEFVIAISSDLLIEHRHFFSDVSPKALGYKALAVNLSDLASMGAIPRWFTLSMGLPKINADWLKAFSQGLHEIAEQFDIKLIGGDTTSSPLITLNITVMGEVHQHRSLKRSGAKIGDDIWVSGELGGASIAVQSRLHSDLNLNRWTEEELRMCLHRLEYPTPRLDLGQALSFRELAHSAIDISDGLIADLDHILELSHVGAELDFHAIPLFKGIFPNEFTLSSGGDDYELCFTASELNRTAIEQLASELNIKLTRIGKITENEHYELVNYQTQERIDLNKINHKGFDHFTSDFSI